MRVPVAIVAVALNLSVTAAPLTRQAPATGGAPAQPAGTAAPRPSPFVPPEPIDHNAHDGWTSIFDGRTLSGWDGNPDVWRVENGAIVADSTAERRVGSTHLIWQGGELADFELVLDFKLDGDIHSGIAYRSYVDVNRATTARAGGAGAGAGGAGAGTGRAAGTSAGANPATPPRPTPQIPTNPKWTLYGPGLDFDADRIMAANVEDRGTDRREVAWRGGIVRAQPGIRPRLIGTLGTADELLALIKPGDWNRVHIIARGHQITHLINDRVMTVFFDDDPAYFRASGLIGLQIESFGLGKVSAREVWIRKW